MNQHQTDINQAREFLKSKLPELAETDFCIYPETFTSQNAFCADEICVAYVKHLEDAGVIKFIKK